MTVKYFSFLLLVSILLLMGCNIFEADKTVFENQTGEISYHGDPAADGGGMQFRIDGQEKVFGVIGGPSDYPAIFEGNENATVKIRTDFEKTGKTSIRGWNTKFTEIRIYNYEVLPE